MPRGDGTGPDGKGPRTGRGLGNCAPNSSENLDDSRSGLGRGLNAGKGRGLRLGLRDRRGGGRGRWRYYE